MNLARQRRIHPTAGGNALGIDIPKIRRAPSGRNPLYNHRASRPTSRAWFRGFALSGLEFCGGVGAQGDALG